MDLPRWLDRWNSLECLLLYEIVWIFNISNFLDIE